MPFKLPKRPGIHHPTERQVWGAQGETLARNHLTRAGLKHMASNVRYRQGELDLVMLEQAGQGATLVFVEVRMRASTAYGGPAASVNPGKQRRLIAAAEQYLQEHYAAHLPACRFDVVTIDGEGKIEWLRDAFQAH